MKRPYSDAHLLAFSQEHPWYEIWMFYEMIDALTRQTASGYVACTTSTTVVTAVGPSGMPNSIAPPPGASTGLTVVRDWTPGTRRVRENTSNGPAKSSTSTPSKMKITAFSMFILHA